MVVDVAELLRRQPQFDWRGVTDLVSSSHSRRSLCVSLQLAHAYLDAELPGEIMEQIAADPQVQRIGAAVFARWANAAGSPQAGLGWLLFTTQGERATDRWRYIRAVAFSPTLAEINLVALPPWLAWAYVPLRPLRLIFTRMNNRE